MSRLILLDAGPLGLVTNPKRSPQSIRCAQWVQDKLRAADQVFVLEIADYEVRRELLRASKQRGLARLDAFIQAVDYLPITTPIIRQAARLWAEARQQGQPTASHQALDADVILAAQALSLNDLNAIIATTNVGHLSRFVRAEIWQNI